MKAELHIYGKNALNEIVRKKIWHQWTRFNSEIIAW